MKYRIMISVGFDTDAEAQVAWTWLKNNQNKFKNIASGEPWTIQIHKCYHDEGKPKSCEIIQEFKGS
jgi:hypothetical protein